MSKNSVSYGPTNGAVERTNDVKFAGNDSKDKMYEPKHKKKLVRVLTVVAYVFSVSLAAIMLSLFYIFIYNPSRPGDDMRSQRNYSFYDRYFNRSMQDSSMNNTYSMEREEPRALPLQPITETIQIEPKIEPIIPSEGIRQFWAKTGFFENGKTSTMLRKILASS